MQNGKCKSQNEKNLRIPGNLPDRLENFAAEVIKWVRGINKTFTGRHIAGKLIRCSTSAGANYEEACGAESRQDFIHKLQIVLKELKESLFWLFVSVKADLTTAESVELLLKKEMN
jgi:four helix bundle protein